MWYDVYTYMLFFLVDRRCLRSSSRVRNDTQAMRSARVMF